YIEKIDSLGGIIPAIESGFIQSEIQKSAYKFEKEMEAGKRIIVGVNKFQTEEKEYSDILKIDAKAQEDQIKFLNKVKSERNNDEVQKKLSNLKKAAEGNDNLMPFILEAVKAYASVGEICNKMREVFGEYKETIVI